VPQGINHFRVGETLFFGNDLFDNSIIEGMKNDVFTLHSQIIEVTEKPSVPYGEMDSNPSGETFDTENIDEEEYGSTQKRGILDIGLLDVSKSDFLQATDEKIEIIGASSDMLVVDLSQTEKVYKVGDVVKFKMDYMGALRVMNSKYISKELVD
jgi:predicted amino acid racemase